MIIQTNEGNLETSGSVPSITWELFGSILTRRMSKGGYGADLEGIEIKGVRCRVSTKCLSGWVETEDGEACLKGVVNVANSILQGSSWSGSFSRNWRQPCGGKRGHSL